MGVHCVYGTGSPEKVWDRSGTEHAGGREGGREARGARHHNVDLGMAWRETRHSAKSFNENDDYLLHSEWLTGDIPAIFRHSPRSPRFPRSSIDTSLSPRASASISALQSADSAPLPAPTWWSHQGKVGHLSRPGMPRKVALRGKRLFPCAFAVFGGRLCKSQMGFSRVMLEGYVENL
jgi:hypothetical protein